MESVSDLIMASLDLALSMASVPDIAGHAIACTRYMLAARNCDNKGY